MTNEEQIADAARWLAEMEAKGEIEWVPDDGWTLDEATISGKGCRSMDNRVVCGKPAVAAMLRPGRNGRRHWWCYCGEHLYGRRIVDGVVLHWRRIAVAS